MAYIYKAPFDDTPHHIDAATAQKIWEMAQTAVPESFDHVDLREHKNSDEKGFLRLTMEFDTIEESEITEDGDLIESIMAALSRSDVRGFRGERAVILNIEPAVDMDTEITSVTAYVGRNVWFNEHRMTSGYPRIDTTQADDVCNEIWNKMPHTSSFIEVDVEEDQDFDGVSAKEENWADLVKEALDTRIALVEKRLVTRDEAMRDLVSDVDRIRMSFRR